MSKEAILKALAQFDSEDFTMWTADGLPAMDKVKSLSGISDLTRAQVTEAAPTFTKSNMSLEGESQETPQVTGEDQEPPVETKEDGETPPEPSVQDQFNPDVQLEEQDKVGENFDFSFFTTENVAELEDDQLQELTVVIDETLASFEKRIAEIRVEMDRVYAAQTLVINEKSGRHNAASSFNNNLKEYLAKQQEVRMAKAKKMEELREAGVELPTGCKLDRLLGSRSRHSKPITQFPRK